MATPTLSQIHHQIKRASAYIKGGKKADLKRLLDGTVDTTTVDKYISNIENVKINRTSVRFYEKMRSLPDVKKVNAHEIYKAILTEANETYSVQALIPYSGLFEFEMPDKIMSRIGFTVMGVKVFLNENEPFGGFAGFEFTYKSQTKNKISVNNKEVAQDYITDGFVFYRGGNIYFTGTAQHTTFFAYVKKVQLPERQPFEGRMIFECDDDNTFVDTEFSLVRHQIPSTKQKPIP